MEYNQKVDQSEKFCWRDNCWCIGNMSSIRTDAEVDPLAKIVRVFHDDNTEKVEILMQLHGSTRTINRPVDESMALSIERIKTNVKKTNAKLRKKLIKQSKQNEKIGELPESDPEPTISLLNNSGEEISGEIPVKEGWAQGRTLKICHLVYDVVYNPAKIESVKLIASPIVGMPIHPQIHLRTATLGHSRFTWYKQLCSNGEPAVLQMETFNNASEELLKPLNKRPKMNDTTNSTESAQHCKESENWAIVGNQKIYTASVDDVGCTLKLVVLPGSEKYPHDSHSNNLHHFIQSVSTTTEGVVQKGPEMCLFDQRHLLTKRSCTDGRFRFVCYNVLADVYAKTEYAKDFLFPYCPEEAIDIGYRQQLVVKELTGYNADIVCLQEVDRCVFESQLMPAMSIEGFAGAFAAKDGLREGVALFYRRKKFRLVMVDNIILRKAIKNERNEDLWSKVHENSSFVKSFMMRGTCLLASLLQSKDDPTKYLLIGNTHLYWHPRGGEIRLIQMEIILRELRHLCKNCETEQKRNVTCILSGDLNSGPDSAVVQLITEGSVPSNHADWYMMGKEEFLPDMHLKNTVKFTSACGFPKYTNFVTGFQKCLDYIFIDQRHLVVDRVIPQPSHEDIIRFTALPNETSPSDHIAQVVDLAWTQCEADDNIHMNIEPR